MRFSRSPLNLAVLSGLFLGSSMVHAAPSESATLSPKLISVQSTETDFNQIITFEFTSPPSVKNFTLTEPQRIVLDFLETSNQSNFSSLDLKGLAAKSVDLVGDEHRLRVILETFNDTVVSDRWDGNKYILTLRRQGAVSPASSTISKENPPASSAMKHQISRVNYQKGSSNGSGKLMIELSNADTKFDVKSQKGGVQIDFLDTASPAHLLKKVDLSDHMTPISNMEIKQLPDRTRVLLRAQGKWEQTAYQIENRFIFEVKPSIPVQEKTDNKDEVVYRGDPVTLDFQDIEVRAILQLLSDFSGYNIIASDSVTGKMTIRLKNVPWDQALDLVLQARSLDKRQAGNVIRIAPQTEIRTQEKSAADYRNEQSNNLPLVSETFSINYAKASDVVTLLTNPQQKILSSRGSAVVDPRTNMVFVQDSNERLNAVRALIKKVDVPVKQVMIEARIVEATDTFGKSLGVRLGYQETQARSLGSKARVGMGGNINSSAANMGEPNSTSSFNDSYMVNLPAAGSGGASPGLLSFVLFNNSATRFLNFELSALVSDGQGQILSNPRVVTSDKQTAHIEQGTQIPYQQASSSGATNVAFKNASLSLDVVPQITPDGNVLMQLKVNKDSVGAQTSAGPAIDTKSINTQVLVEDGGTLVIGGIYTQDDSATSAKIPFFGDLPFVGHLFKQNANSRERREMLVFITPRIISDKLLSDDTNASTISSESITPILMDPNLVNAQGRNIKDLKFPKPRFDHE